MKSTVIVVGDYIEDVYRFCTATRLCPEGPVAILKEESTRRSAGGAALVASQLSALGVSAFGFFGSSSIKERVFADGHLVSRIDFDDSAKTAVGFSALADRIDEFLPEAKLLIVSDYDKGTFSETTAQSVLKMARNASVPVFVDAKENWMWYDGAYAVFPNETEGKKGLPKSAHLVRKLGRQGCAVDGVLVEASSVEDARDITGAGDVFLAAFATRFLRTAGESPFLEAAAFANKIAGLSIRHVGTHVVTKSEMEAHHIA